MLPSKCRSPRHPVIPSPRPAGLDRNSSESCDLAITATGGKRLTNGCRLLNSQAIEWICIDDLFDKWMESQFMGIRTLRTLTFNSICEMNVLSLLICTYLPCPSDASQWSCLALRFHGRREQPEESRCETRSKSAENLQCISQECKHTTSRPLFWSGISEIKMCP